MTFNVVKIEIPAGIRKKLMCLITNEEKSFMKLYGIIFRMRSKNSSSIPIILPGKTGINLLIILPISKIRKMTIKGST